MNPRSSSAAFSRKKNVAYQQKSQASSVAKATASSGLQGRKLAPGAAMYNARGAKTNAMLQEQNRAKSLLARDKAFGIIPQRGLEPAKVGVPEFDSLDAAKQAARDYYTKYGTSDPAIDAAVYRLENPDFVPENSGGVRTGEDVRANLTRIATNPALSRQATIRRSQQKQKDKVFDIARKSTDQKYQDAGINTQRAGLYDFLSSQGMKPSGTFQGRVSFSNISPDLVEKLTALGVVDTTAPSQGGGGNMNVVLNISEEDFNEQFPQYEYIKGGGDVKDALNQYSQYERETTSELSGMEEGGTGEEMGIGGQEPGSSGEVTGAGSSTSSLPGYGATPEEFIDQYGFMGKSMVSAGKTRKEAIDQMSLDELDSRLMYAQGSADAAERRERTLKFNEQLDTMDRNRELASHEKALQITQLDNDRAEAIARDQAEEDEAVSRRVAARLGITMDGGGIKWLRDIVRKSNEHLSYMIQRGGIEEASLVKEHEQNMDGIDYNSKIRYDQAWDTYDSSLATLKKDRILDKKAAREERRKIDKEYNDKVFEIDKWKGEQYLTEIRRSEDRAFEKWKMEENHKHDKSLAEAKSKSDLTTANRKLQFDAYETAGKTYDRIINSQSYKDFLDVGNAAASANNAWNVFQTAKATSTNPNDYAAQEGAASTAITTAFAKVIDPGSVVRTEEARMVLEQGGLWDAWKKYGLQVFTGAGGKLTEEQMKVLVDHIDELEGFQRNRLQEQIAPLVSTLSTWSRETGVSMDELYSIGVPDGVVGQFDDIGSFNNDYSGPPEVDIYDPGSFDANLPPTGSFVDTTVGSGTITGYGSAASAAGLDLAGSYGAPVYAPMGGTIEEVTFNESWRGDPFSDAKDFTSNKKGKSEKYARQSGQNGGYGNSVVMKLDNGMKIRLSHLSYADPIMKGQRIEFGSPIGKIGNTGITYGATGTHVDIEMSDGGKTLSPRQVAAFIGATKGPPSLGGGSTPTTTETANAYQTSPIQVPGSVPPQERKNLERLMAAVQNPQAAASGMAMQEFAKMQGKLSKKAVKFLGTALAKTLSSARASTNAFASGFQSY